jgi:hypothetical protein
MFFLNENLENALVLFDADLEAIANKYNISIGQLYKHFNYLAQGKKINYRIFDGSDPIIVEDCLAAFHKYFHPMKPAP